MKFKHLLLLSFTLFLFAPSCKKEIPAEKATSAINQDSLFIATNYQKTEYLIPMRDGIKLYTAVYAPKDQSEAYPIMLKRTPYSCRPYGEQQFPTSTRSLGPSDIMVKEKFIFVHQDVRGRYMSEGEYDNMRPMVSATEKEKGAIDESTDTFDTIDFLVKNVKNNNGKVGMWGISYPGFYTAAGTASNHPALKASSPQAPISDFFFDDFHHHGAFMLSYWRAIAVFGYQKEVPVKKSWYPLVDFGTPDAYQFLFDLGPLKNAGKYYGEDNFFWQQITEHPNYDEFWQSRNLLPHLKGIDHAVMTVGGWFDAEDLYGPLNVYKTIEKQSGNYNTLVMGPWSHGDWSRPTEQQLVGNIYFGDNISSFYQAEIEFPFFHHFLKDDTQPLDLPEAYLFDTGLKEWKKFGQWPVPASKKLKLVPLASGELHLGSIGESGGFSEFISDPAKPVPFTEDIKVTFTPRKYMTDDQRHNSRRPDVLVFTSAELQESITLGGEITANLFVSTSESDADWIVKIIDVFPPNEADHPHDPDHVRMGGYQMLVRSEMFRGRFRNDYSKPEPFQPGKITKVSFPLQDVLHTFKPGHRIMVHIQSTWFPLIDRNPQKYVENIFEAEEADFKKAIHRVSHQSGQQTHLEVEVLK